MKNRGMKGFFFVFLFLISEAWGEKNRPWPEKVEFDRIEGQSMFLKGFQEKDRRAVVETTLHDLEYLGTFRDEKEESIPYFLLRARTCSDCNHPKNLYAISADGQDAQILVHPGEIREEKGRLIYQGEAYFGKCLPKNEAQLFISFQKDRADRRRYLQRSVLIAEVKENRMVDRLLVRRREKPKRRSVLKQVKKKVCQKIDPINRKTDLVMIELPELKKN